MQVGLLNPTFQTACGLVGFSTQPTRCVTFLAFHYIITGLAALTDKQYNSINTAKQQSTKGQRPSDTN